MQLANVFSHLFKSCDNVWIRNIVVAKKLLKDKKLGSHLKRQLSPAYSFTERCIDVLRLTFN